MDRERFEAWIAGPPYERETSRHPGSDEETAWPGQYVDVAVQLAWEAWQEAAPRWTAVADALPAEGVEVLVWFRKGFLSPWLAEWNGRNWQDGAGGGWGPGDVQAWMPLPAGPREEGEEP